MLIKCVSCLVAACTVCKLFGGCMYSLEVVWWLHVQSGSCLVAACTVCKLFGGCMYSLEDL